MIDLESVFILPLVHHLVHQGVDDLFPPMAPYVPPTDGDLPKGSVAVSRWLSSRRAVERSSGRAVQPSRRIVPQPALHSPRDPNRHHAQLAAEVFPVEA